MEASPVRPITGCVRADAEASDLIRTLKGSVAASWAPSGGGGHGVDSSTRQAHRLSEQLQASFREQQELINENAALQVRCESLEREVAKARNERGGVRDLEVLLRAKEAEMEKLGSFWGERLSDAQTRSAELEGELEALQSEHASLSEQLSHVKEAFEVQVRLVRDRDSEVEKAAARVAALEEIASSHRPHHHHQQRPPSSEASQGKSSAHKYPPKGSAMSDAGGGLDIGALSVELETLRGQLEAANMRAESMAARADSKEALALEAVKRAERVSCDNKEIMRSLRGAEDSTDMLRVVEERNKMLEVRVAELITDRKALESDRDSLAKVVKTLEERLATETRELSAARLALESKNRQCESAARELDAMARKHAGCEEHAESMHAKLSEAQAALLVTRQQAAEKSGRTFVLEEQVRKFSDEAESNRRRRDDALNKLSSVVETLGNSQRERKELLVHLQMCEELAQQGDTSLLTQLQLCREQQEACERRAARAEQSLARVRLDADAMHSRQIFAETEAVERSERLRAARLQVEAAVKRQQEAESFALSEVTGRRREAAQAKIQLAEARKQLHECEMALVKAEQEQDGVRCSTSSAHELEFRLRMEMQRKESLEWRLQETESQLDKMQGTEAELERVGREVDLLQVELAAVRQEGLICKAEARDIRERFGEAQSALQAARRRLQTMQQKIDTLLQERERLHAALQSHEEVVKAMGHELEHTRKVQKILHERDKGREQQLSGIGMQMSKLKLLKQAVSSPRGR